MNRWVALSTVLHSGLVVAAVFGGGLFAPEPQPQIAGAEVSLISGARFDAMAAAATMEVTPTLHPPVPALAPVVPVSAPKPPVAAAPRVVSDAPVTSARAVPVDALTPAPDKAEPAQAPMLAPVGENPVLAPAAVATPLAPKPGALTPVAPRPEALKPAQAPTLVPVPETPDMVAEAEPEPPKPEPKKPEPKPPEAKKPEQAAEKKPDRKTATDKPKAEKKPGKATAKGAQEADSSRGSDQGATKGQSDTGRKTAKAKVAGNAKVSNYGGLVLKKISRTKKPKAPAKGVVVVGFTIGAGGNLASVRVLRGSGSDALDRVALDHIRRSAPFPAPPEGARRDWSFEFVGRP